MEKLALALAICLAVICSGCGMEMMSPGTTTKSTPTTVESDSAEPVVEIPAAYGPLGQRHRAVKELDEVFRSVQVLRQTERFTLSELKAISKVSRFSPVTVSGCDLETLKVFVSSNWPPVVVIRSPVGPKHIRAVVGYDDSAQRLTLVDPVNLKQGVPANLGYSEFSKQWDDPQKTCLLVYSQYMGEDRIKSVLKKYMSEEKADSIVIRTAR